jgi:hypothetical protein
MACWSRVFSGTTAQQSSGSGCCSITAGACNITSADQINTKPTLFDEMPVAVGSIGEAVGYWVEQLRRRMDARALITATSDTVYTITLRRGTKTDSVSWQLSNSMGAMPLIVGYSTLFDSASGVQFQNMNHALDWLVERLV